LWNLKDAIHTCPSTILGLITSTGSVAVISSKGHILGDVIPPKAVIVILNSSISVTSSMDQIIAHLLCHFIICLMEGAKCSVREVYPAARGFLKAANILEKMNCGEKGMQPFMV
jgi:hypothetical protein